MQNQAILNEQHVSGEFGQFDLLDSTPLDSSEDEQMGPAVRRQPSPEPIGARAAKLQGACVMSVTSCISGTLREMLWDGISAGDRLARQCIERLTQLELRFPYTYLTMSLGLSPGYLHSDWSGLIEARIKAEFAAAGFGEVQMTLTSLDRWSLMPKPPRARLPGLEVAVLTCSALRFPESEDEMPSFASPIEALSWCRSGSVVPAAGRHAGRVAAKPAG